MAILMPFVYMSIGSLATIFTIGMMQAASRSDNFYESDNQSDKD